MASKAEEENIIYEDDNYIFYENSIYSKRCYKYLIKRKGGKGAITSDGYINGVNYWWSHLQTPISKKSKWYRVKYPITLESLKEVYIVSSS
jgi:hypothetical protein